MTSQSDHRNKHAQMCPHSSHIAPTWFKMSLIVCRDPTFNQLFQSEGHRVGPAFALSIYSDPGLHGSYVHRFNLYPLSQNALVMSLECSISSSSVNQSRQNTGALSWNRQKTPVTSESVLTASAHSRPQSVVDLEAPFTVVIFIEIASLIMYEFQNGISKRGAALDLRL